MWEPGGDKVKGDHLLDFGMMSWHTRELNIEWKQTPYTHSELGKCLNVFSN